jgi:hypothetical protein
MPQRLEGAVLSTANGNYSSAHAGGVVVLASALANSLTLTTSSGATMVVPGGSSGTYPVPSSGGAPNTSWQYANNADIGKASLVVATPNGFI